MNKRNIGGFYEQAVCEYLTRQGLVIVEKNFRCRIGEIDIIARDGNTLAFIEVKYRKDASYGSPLEAVTPKKQGTIRRVAQYYMAFSDWKGFLRFDVIGICADEITWIKNAF